MRTLTGNMAFYTAALLSSGNRAFSRAALLISGYILAYAAGAITLPLVHQVDTRWCYNPEMPNVTGNWAFDTAAFTLSKFATKH